MQPELTLLETTLLAIGVSVGCAALLVLSFSAMKLLLKWALGTVVPFIIKSK